VGGDASPGVVKPPSLDIWWSVNRPSTCDHVLSCQAFNAAAFRGPDSGGAYPVLEALSTASGSPGVSQAGLRGWAVTGVPRYPGYKTPKVAPEPFVERMARVIRSMGGRISTHMLL
jgi:hypothetical protein